MNNARRVERGISLVRGTTAWALTKRPYIQTSLHPNFVDTPASLSCYNEQTHAFNCVRFDSKCVRIQTYFKPMYPISDLAFGFGPFVVVPVGKLVTGSTTGISTVSSFFT